MRKVFITLLTVLFSFFCHLEAADFSCSIPVGRPNCGSNFSCGIMGRLLYMQPISDNLCYAAEVDQGAFPSVNWKIHEIRPHFNLGYEVGLGCMCNLSGANAVLSWTHFKANDGAEYCVGSSSFIGPFFEVGPDALPYVKAHGQVCFEYDAINLNFGLCVPFGQCLQANFFGGVGSVYLRQDLHTRFFDEDETIIRSIKVPSKFIGVGPQLGLGLAFNVIDCVQLTGRASGSLLMGGLKNHTEFESFSPVLADLDIEEPNVQRTSVKNRRQLVPAIEGRLALSFSLPMCDLSFDLELGYEAKIYINAIQSVDIGSEVAVLPAPSTAGVFARTFRRTISNYAMAGPYAALSLKF